MSRNPGSAPPHSHPRGSLNLDGMVAVAAGGSARVARWAAALRNASIRCVVANPYANDSHETPSQDYAEVWVPDDDADRANSVLRASDTRETQLLW